MGTFWAFWTDNAFWSIFTGDGGQVSDFQMSQMEEEVNSCEKRLS